MSTSARSSLFVVIAGTLGCSTPAATDAGADLGVDAYDPCSAMVVVPGGAFFRGCAPGDTACTPDEMPTGMLTISTFAIGVTEVTNTCYQRCVTAGRCTAPSGVGITLPEFPVVGVDDRQAAAYCAYLGGRLPTEAEWEKAARGTDMRVYPWGNASPTCDLANSYGCSGSADPVGSHPTGASPYGALDMAGNVEEWVSDWYDATYYASSPTTDPQGPATGVHRVRRGGAQNYLVAFLRCSNRGDMDPPGATPNLGFRCVRPMAGADAGH